MGTDSILDIRNLTIAFAGQPALKNFSFSIAPGECLALVGESGSGKSLTALAIMGLLPPTAELDPKSSIVLNGVALDNAPEETRRAVRRSQAAMIFQEPLTSLNPVMRCGRQVTEHLSGSKAERKAKAIDLFDEVELPEPDLIYKAYPHELSGGQKQRVMIAMALANSPQLLIADEPTTALDVTVQARVLSLLHRLRQERQLALLFITHDFGVVRTVADRVAVLYRGDGIESGNVKQVMEAPKATYTQALLESRPPVKGRPHPLPTVTDFLSGNLPVQRERSSSVNREHVVLEVAGLAKTFRSGKRTVHAVNGVSFQLFEGEVLGLVGESGCGKSTLGRCISGLIRPDRGTISFSSASKRARVMQLIFQDPFSSLTPTLTVGDMLDEVQRVHFDRSVATRRERTAQTLETVGLPPEAAGRYPHEFSGGQRQRLVIARAIMCEPQLLLCDESVSALDVSVQAQVLNLLLDLKATFGLSMLFISHDLNVVRYLSDRIMVMQQGEIVENGLADEIMERPRHPYTHELLSAIPNV